MDPHNVLGHAYRWMFSVTDKLPTMAMVVGQLLKTLMTVNISRGEMFLNSNCETKFQREVP